MTLLTNHTCAGPCSEAECTLVSLSFGQAFLTEDRWIGTGTTASTPVATSHSYQVVASRTVRKTDPRLTLGHVTSSAERAQIDLDTGLPQFDEGPTRLRSMTVAQPRASISSLPRAIPDRQREISILPTFRNV